MAFIKGVGAFIICVFILVLVAFIIMLTPFLFALGICAFIGLIVYQDHKDRKERENKGA